MIRSLILAVCLLLSTATVAEAYVVGGYGYAPYGGYGWTYPAGVRYYRPINRYDYRCRCYHRQVILSGGRYYYLAY